MTEIIKIRKALLMTKGIKKVQEGIVMESLEIPVDNLQNKVIQEEVVGECSKNEERTTVWRKKWWKKQKL